jgi:hypothetical protein
VTWKGEQWDRGIVKVLMGVYDAMEGGMPPSAVLAGKLPASEVRRLDRLSHRPTDGMAALLARWATMNEEERECYMRRVLSNWKRAKGYGE